jgi:hypothetical protein
MASMISPFIVLKNMCDQNKHIYSFPEDNLMGMGTGKDGWGYIKIAITNEIASRIMVGDPLVINLLVYDFNEYQQIKKELEGVQE